ncbi:MAG TPA: biosynthetic arginine decarboxylase, partial [Pirellulales bacterium]
GVPHPDIISESGRAVVAYHSVLVFNVLGVAGLSVDGQPENVPEPLPESYEQCIWTLQRTLKDLHVRNALESYHDAQQAFDTALNLFNAGYLPLKQRADAENLYWCICRRLLHLTKQMDEVPEDLQGLDAQLADTFFCNFSLFQSVPDSWAIKQLFPIMPIHRLCEPPNRQAVLGDITCDSDGKIDQFIDRRDVKRTLPLHPFNGEPYYLGAFLIGAYQEILGDMHNLFGDTHCVHVGLNDAGETVIQAVVKGDTVREVLDYVEFNATSLVNQLRTDVDTAVRAGRLTDKNAGQLMHFYEQGLGGYTYLEEPHES